MVDGRRWLRLSTAVEAMRSQPEHSSELVSEARGGERLEAIEFRGEWIRVRSEDNYEGWLHSWTCEDWPAQTPTFVGRYRRPLGTLWLSDHHAASPLYLGLPLLRVPGELESRGGRRLIATPWAVEGWIDESDIEGFADASIEVSALLRFGRSLVGVPYRWGGRSPLGFDCSAYVQYLFALCDRALPRDARQQVEHGESVGLDPEAWQRGDLLFFGGPVDHVGVYSGRGRLLHCSGQVKEELLGKNPQLVERLCTARRVWDSLDCLSESWWAGRALPRES
jgi:gamma-D-glutamyl-L-lysine dipeptidyl-peptidase